MYMSEMTGSYCSNSGMSGSDSERREILDL